MAGLASALACNRTREPSDEALRARAKATLAPLQRDLKSALQDALGKGDVPGAVDACSLKAQAITTAASSPGVHIGRTSHKLRNPANVAPSWVRPELDRLASSNANVEQGVVVRLANGGFGYVEPIRTNGLCVTCHGEAIAPEVQRAIATRYPEDRATGYGNDAFRGVFWVEFSTR
jgi:hypothetical protein